MLSEFTDIHFVETVHIHFMKTPSFHTVLLNLYFTLFLHHPLLRNSIVHQLHIILVLLIIQHSATPILIIQHYLFILRVRTYVAINGLLDLLVARQCIIYLFGFLVLIRLLFHLFRYFAVYSHPIQVGFHVEVIDLDLFYELITISSIVRLFLSLILTEPSHFVVIVVNIIFLQNLLIIIHQLFFISLASSLFILQIGTLSVQTTTILVFLHLSNVHVHLDVQHEHSQT